MNRLLLLFMIVVNISCFAQKTEMLDINFCYNLTYDTSKVYANVTLKNITDKTVGYIVDKGFLINPHVIFRINDSIVSDTLYFNVFHPNYHPGDFVVCTGCENDTIPFFLYSNDEVVILKKKKSNTIKLVLTKDQYKLIKHVKINVYSFYVTKKKSDPIEKKVYIISMPFDCNDGRALKE